MAADAVGARWRSWSATGRGRSGGTALGGGQLAIVLATRVTITPDAEACARFAAISPSQAVDRVALAQRFDMFEVRTTVTPTAVNETGWEFEVGCAPAPSPGASRGVRLGWATDGHPRFLWLVSYGDDWGLLGGMTWVDWDTGELLPPQSNSDFPHSAS